MTIRPLLALSVVTLMVGCGSQKPAQPVVSPQQKPVQQPTVEPSDLVPDEPATTVANNQPGEQPPAPAPAEQSPVDPPAQFANVDTSPLDLPVTEAEIPRNIQETLELDLSDGDDTVEKLAALLSHENVAVRRKAAISLSHMAGKSNRADWPIPDMGKYLDALCQATRDPDQTVREKVYFALQYLGEDAEPAIPYLLVGMSEKEAYVRATAARTFQAIGTKAEPVVPALVRLRNTSLQNAELANPFSFEHYHFKGVAHSTVIALAGIGGTKARTIIPSLKREILEGNTAMTQAEALGRFGEVDFLASLVSHENQNVRQSAGFGLGHVRPTTERVIAALTRLTEDKEQQVRMKAIEAFKQCDPKLPSAVPALVAAFDDEYEYAAKAAQRIVSTYEGSNTVRMLALVKAMLKLDREDFSDIYYSVNDKAENVPPLLELMADTSQPNDIRAGAGFLLYQFDSDDWEPHVSAIRALYNDETVSLEARMYANICLNSMSEKDIDPQLATEMFNSSKINFALIDTVDALGDDEINATYQDLVALLDRKDTELAIAVVRSLGSVDESAHADLAVSKLIALSTSTNDIDILQQIAYALGSLGGGSESAEATLVKLCRHEDGDVQSAAASGLGTLGLATPEAVVALRELLKDEYTWWEAAEALEGAGEIAAPAIPDLVALLDNEDAPVSQVIQTLSSLGEPAVEPALDKILSLAKSEDEEHRYAVAYALGSFSGHVAKVEPVLIKLLDDDDDDVIDAACESAASLKLPGSVSALLKVIESETNESYTIRLALDALHAIGPEAKAAIPAVKQLVENEADRYVRERAGEVLAKLAPNDPELMATRLLTIEPYDDDAQQIIRSLGDAAVPTLEKLLLSDDADDRQRGMGLMAFLPMTDAVKATFAKALDSESAGVRSAAAIAASNAGLGNNERVVSLLIDALTDDDLQYEAQNALSSGDLSVMRPVAAAVADDQRSIATRRAAARFLADHAYAAVWIIPQLQQATTSDDAELAILSAAAIARIQNHKANVPLLLSALDEEVEDETVVQALTALYRASFDKHPAAIDRLIEALNHENGTVSTFASYTLNHHELSEAQVVKVAALLTNKEAIDRGYPIQAAAAVVADSKEFGAKYLPRIVELFRGTSANDSYQYGNALSNFGPAAVPQLIELIGDPNLSAEHRTRAVSAVVSISYDNDIDTKTANGLLSHDDLAIRVAGAAVLALADSDPSTLLPPLLEGIQSDNDSIMEIAFGALERMEPQPTAVTTYKKLLAQEDFVYEYELYRLVSQLGADAEPLIADLIAVLAKPDPDDDFRYERERVANTLAQLDPAFTPRLTEALKHQSPQVRFHVLAAIAQQEETPAETSDAVAPLMNDPDPNVAMYAAITLLAIDPREEALPKVVEALKLDVDENPHAYVLHGSAMNALQRAAESGEILKPIVPQLAEMLATSDEKYRLFNTFSAMKEHAQPALPVLIDTLRNDRQNRWQALNTIEQIGLTPEATAALLDIIRQGDSQHMARAAAILNDEGEAAAEAFDILLPMLRQPNRRYQAIVTLGNLKSQAPQVTPLLEKALRSGDDELIVASLNATRFLEDTAAPLAPALLTLLRSEDHRVNSIRALGSLGEAGAEAVPSLSAGLKHAELEVRRASASALGSIGAPAGMAVPEMIPLLDDPDLADTVVSALGSIGPRAESAIPRLIELLDEKDRQFTVVGALESFGPAASAALPKLRELEASQTGWRKDRVTEAIAAIEGKAVEE